MTRLFSSIAFSAAIWLGAVSHVDAQAGPPTVDILTAALLAARDGLEGDMTAVTARRDLRVHLPSVATRVASARTYPTVWDALQCVRPPKLCRIVDSAHLIDFTSIQAMGDGFRVGLSRHVNNSDGTMHGQGLQITVKRIGTSWVATNIVVVWES